MLTQSPSVPSRYHRKKKGRPPEIIQSLDLICKRTPSRRRSRRRRFKYGTTGEGPSSDITATGTRCSARRDVGPRRRRPVVVRRRSCAGIAVRSRRRRRRQSRLAAQSRVRRALRRMRRSSVIDAAVAAAVVVSSSSSSSSSLSITGRDGPYRTSESPAVKVIGYLQASGKKNAF